MNLSYIVLKRAVAAFEQATNKTINCRSQDCRFACCH